MADWRSLLEIALPALDEVFGSEADPSSPDWTVGGGAAIGVELDHRGTEDVDIFLQRGRLKQFLPRSNAASKAISETPQWPGHHLKFELQSGEIDFLTAPLLTEPGFANRLMLGRSIAFETPEEVLVKKMRYRAATFTARDVFDLAVVLHCRPGLPDVLAAEVSDKLAVVQERIRLHASRGIAAIEQQISPTRFGRGILPHVFELAERALSEARSATREASPTPRSIAKGPDDVRDPGIGPRPVDKGRDR